VHMHDRRNRQRAGWSGKRPSRMAGLVAALTAVLATSLSLLLGVTPAAAQTAGRVLAWGGNDQGQLGIPGNVGFADVPTQASLPAGATATDVAGGEAHSLAVTSAGVFAWGANGSGQLGTGNNAGSRVPVPVEIPSGTVITAVAAGGEHSLALTSTGRVLAWGSNSAGQLGNPGVGESSNLPVPVLLPPGATVTGIAAGGDHSLAVTSTGQVLAWGLNEFGELGNGTSDNFATTPVAVDLPPGTAVTAVAAGENFSVARTATGSVLAWGLNDQGQLGNGTTDNSDVPTPVSLPSGTTVTSVTTGALGNHTLVLTAVGDVFAWGSNEDFQLGNGDPNPATSPLQVALPPNTTATAVAAAGRHSLALTSSGQLLAWGDNGFGQTGNGTSGGATESPTQVSLPSGATVTTIAAGANQNLAVSPSTVPGPDSGDGTTATTGPSPKTLMGTVLVAAALMAAAAVSLRRRTRRRHGGLATTRP